jgi:hypothetical protein
LILPRLVHHVYSKHAEVTVPSLDDWEKGWKEKLKAETLKLEMPELRRRASGPPSTGDLPYPAC